MLIGSEFHSLEVIGINDLAKTLVRFLSNLTEKGCWALEICVFLANKALGGIVDFSSSEQKPMISIVQGEGRNFPAVSQGLE